MSKLPKHNVIKICHLECWSIVVNRGSLTDVNADALRALCKYEYGIDITIEMYHCIREDRLHILPNEEDGTTKFYYFKKSIREVPEDV